MRASRVRSSEDGQQRTGYRAARKMDLSVLQLRSLCMDVVNLGEIFAAIYLFDRA